ncbi:MAG: methyltransferase domain-containing protein [Cyanobacteria bacterium J06621_8]
MQEYQTKAINSLTSKYDIKGKKILEIGGDLSHSVASYLVNHGAQHVTSINIDPKFPTKEVSQKISAKNLSATELTNYYNEETFDVVFGVAILEHIDNTPLLLNQIYSVLKKNGLVLLQGGPIWTCSIGHHVWVNCDENIYRFNNHKINPIPNWYHLLLSPNEMQSYLVEQQNISSDHADKIVSYIYEERDLSRIGYADFFDIFQASQFKILEAFQRYGAKPDHQVLSQLKDVFSEKHHNFEINGIQFLLQKTT